MDNEQPKKPRLPSITLRLTNPIVFNVEVDYEAPSLYIVRAMLTEGLHSIQREIEDAEAVQFQKRMGDAAQAFRAMQKKPGHV